MNLSFHVNGPIACGPSKQSLHPPHDVLRIKVARTHWNSTDRVNQLVVHVIGSKRWAGSASVKHGGDLEEIDHIMPVMRGLQSDSSAIAETLNAFSAADPCNARRK